jgi:hypothetical protein
MLLPEQRRAYHCPYIPEASELAAVVEVCYAPNGRGLLLLKFRDLNSSASVMLGEAVYVGV